MRVGKNRRAFRMLKFRTMVPDAHDRFHEVAHLNVATGMTKIPDDPRVTRVGRILRKYSLDEVPQLFNVLLRDMSLVGPRPHDVTEPMEDTEANRLRLSVRPEITGWWQVTARNDVSIETRIKCDLAYIEAFSLVTDLRIMLRARGSSCGQGWSR